MKKDRQYIYFDSKGQPELVESRNLMFHIWKQIRNVLENSYVDIANIDIGEAPTFKQIYENRMNLKPVKFKVFGSFLKLQVVVEKDNGKVV